MNKNIIYKYFNNQASNEELDELIEWIEKSDDNRDFFAEQKVIWDISLPQLSFTSLQRNNKKNILKYFVAACIISLLIANILFIKFRLYDTSQYHISSLPEESLRTLYTEKGLKAHLVLPDNSKVWLNSDTKITYPAQFSNDIREIEISGEAYFEVVKDSLRPMIVRTNRNLTIEVLGTSFSVKSYDNDNSAKTTLYNGSIKMHYTDKNNKNKSLYLSPSESFTYYDNKIIPQQVATINNKKDIAWKEGKLIFNETPMPEVIKMLERWHGTKFIIDNKTFLNNNLTAIFQDESIIQILNIMKYCINMDYILEDNCVTITVIP